MKMKTTTKRFLVLFLAVMAMMVNANAWSVPYATLSGSTLTFQYGELPTGQDVYNMSNEKFYDKWSSIVTSITKITIDPSFAEVRFKTCAKLFYGMSNLESIEGLQYLNTSEVTNMYGMFAGCISLATLNVSSFNTSKVTDMSFMFQNCIKLTELDVSGFNTSNVTNMNAMFMSCGGLTNLDVRKFDTSNVANMGSMFCLCQELTDLDVRGFNTYKVTDMRSMFYGCLRLTTIYCNDKWSCGNSSGMFSYCKKLKGAISYDSSKEDATYANPATGYFTRKSYSYELWIAGTQVTDDNKDNIPVRGGTVTYNSDANMLSLSSATITATGTNGYYKTAVYNEMEGLRIRVYNNCKLTSDNDCGIVSTGSLIIEGWQNSTLSITAPTAVAMTSEEDNTLSIRNGIKLTLDGTSYYGVTSRNSNTKMEVMGSDTEVKTRGVKECYSQLKDIKLYNKLALTEPAGAYISGGKVYASDGSIVKNEWTKIALDNSTTVRRIEITDYTWPKDFEPADYEVTSPTNGVKSVSVGYCWGSKVIDNYEASAGDHYTIVFTVELEDGYEFPADNDYSAFIERDGETVYQDERANGLANNQKRFAWNSYYVPTPEGGTYMRTAKDTITAPVIGAEPVWEIAAAAGAKAAGALPEANPKEQFQRDFYCPVDDILWFEKVPYDVDDLGRKLMSRGDKFQPGKTYGVIMKVSPVSGQQFHNNTQFSVNGETAQYWDQLFYYVESAGAYYRLHNSTEARLCYVFPELSCYLGDVNKDGAVTMADANAVVNYYLATEKPEDFPLHLANVNNDYDDDGKPAVTMADANQIVNSFLSGAEPQMYAPTFDHE